VLSASGLRLQQLHNHFPRNTFGGRISSWLLGDQTVSLPPRIPRARQWFIAGGAIETGLLRLQHFVLAVAARETAGRGKLVTECSSIRGRSYRVVILSVSKTAKIFDCNAPH